MHISPPPPLARVMSGTSIYIQSFIFVLIIVLVVLTAETFTARGIRDGGLLDTLAGLYDMVLAVG